MINYQLILLFYLVDIFVETYQSKSPQDF